MPITEARPWVRLAAWTASARPCRFPGKGFAARLRRVVAPRQDPSDIAQGRERVCAFGRAFRQIRQVVRDPRQQRAQLCSRQAHQFGYRKHSHCFLHRFPAAPIAAFWRRPQRRRRRVHRLRPKRRGGVRSTCAHQPRNGASWPKEGRGWCGGDGGRWVLRRQKSTSRKVQ
jgi:hypothetical protein